MVERINRVPTEVMDIYVTGRNDQGQLCMGPGWRERQTLQMPVRNGWLTDNYDFVTLAVGNNHCLGITSSGHVLSWGSNEHGGLGRLTTIWKNPDGTWIDYDTLEARDRNPHGPDGRRIDGVLQTPRHIDISENICFTQVAVSDHASFALTDTGHVFGWGAFKVGCLFLHVSINTANLIFSTCTLVLRQGAYEPLLRLHPEHMHFYATNPRYRAIPEWGYQETPLEIRFPGTDNPQIVQIA